VVELKDIHAMRPENRNDIATASAANATPFNPFDALGVPAEQMTKEQINQHFRRASLHLVRATATPLFPTQAEINAARDYLRDAAATPRMARAVATWGLHRQTFFADLEVGSPNVFTATRATVRAGPAPIPVSASSTRGQASNPKKRKGQASVFATASATPGSSQANPVNLDDDEEDEEVLDRGDDKGQSLTVGGAGGTAGGTGGIPTRSRRAAKRSSGRSARAVPVVNADPTLEIVVGEWRGSTGTPRNAVIARFDGRGRLNFRIVARGYGTNQSVPGPTATATATGSIDFMGPYAGMTYEDIRACLTQQLSNSLRLNK